MDIFKLLNFLEKHRKKILLFAHLNVIFNTIYVAIAILQGRFEWFDLVFWTWTMGISTFVILQLQFGDHE